MTEEKLRRWVRRGVISLVVAAVLVAVGTPAVMTVVFAFDEYTAPGDAPGRAMDFVVSMGNNSTVMTAIVVCIVFFAWGVTHLMAVAPSHVRSWRLRASQSQ